MSALGHKRTFAVHASMSAWAISGHPEGDRADDQERDLRSWTTVPANAVTPHSGSYRFARNRSKQDPRDAAALFSGFGSQELRSVYCLVQITALIAINANSKISIIEFNPKSQFFWGIDRWQFEQANLEGPNPRDHGVA